MPVQILNFLPSLFSTAIFSRSIRSISCFRFHELRLLEYGLGFLLSILIFGETFYDGRDGQNEI